MHTNDEERKKYGLPEAASSFPTIGISSPTEEFPIGVKVACSERLKRGKKEEKT